MKSAVLVFGPESSGTRLVTRALINLGCLGDGDHKQSFDTVIPKAINKHIVWRRSVPHSNKWPDPEVMCNAVRVAGYRPVFVITTREWLAMAKSQVQHGHAKDQPTALSRIRLAFRLLGNSCFNLAPFIVVNYESLILDSQVTMSTVSSVLGLDLPTDSVQLETVVNNNSKHYKDVFNQNWGWS